MLLSQRASASLAGLWAGILVGVALIGAPAAFALSLPAQQAGAIAGRMFAQEAQLTLGFVVVLFVLLRPAADRAAAGGTSSVFSLDIMIVLATLFCTVAGYFALQPMMAAARAGQGALSFGALHVISVAFYGVKTLLVMALTWRLVSALTLGRR